MKCPSLNATSMLTAKKSASGVKKSSRSNGPSSSSKTSRLARWTTGFLGVAALLSERMLAMFEPSGKAWVQR